MWIDTESIKELARRLRKNSTKTEQLLWNEIRNRRFYGLKFLRQHPIIFDYYDRTLFFIADFYCAEKKIVIEVDGAVHKSQTDYDSERDLIMKEVGLKILRIKTEEFHNLDAVLERIKHACFD